MGIIASIVFGLIAGVIAKLAYAGARWRGFILTCILGIVGAVVMDGWRRCLVLAAVSAALICTVSSSPQGAIVVLVIFRLLRRG